MQDPSSLDKGLNLCPGKAEEFPSKTKFDKGTNVMKWGKRNTGHTFFQDSIQYGEMD